MKYWQSIDDLPIYYYYKVLETNDLKHLVYEMPSKIDVDHLKKVLNPVWDKIELEYFDMLSKDPNYIDTLKDDIRFQIKKVKAQISSLAYDKIIFEGEKRKKAMENSEYDYYKSIALLTKNLNFAIDDKKLSVRMYFTHFNMLKNGK